ncbi:MAG: hypothetical protein P8R42_10145 [Candidatus Binatia bacterium]|nr:hypothetical protein [Candidatus Binatia bacterium]
MALLGQAPRRYPLPVRWVPLAAIGVAANQPSLFEAASRTGDRDGHPGVGLVSGSSR